MNIAKLRKDKGWSQKDVALKLKIKANVLSNYELGKRKPPIEVLIKLSDLFGCTIDELVKGE